MSVESVDKRLTESTPGPWEVQTFAPDDPDIAAIGRSWSARGGGIGSQTPVVAAAWGKELVGKQADFDLIAHARTDLEVANEVVRVAKEQHHQTDALRLFHACSCGRAAFDCSILKAIERYEGLS